MAKVRRVYWDSGIFISYLSDTHPKEKERADIAMDILKQAQDGKIEIWTSVWTIAEVIRPKSEIPDTFPLPNWAELLNATDEKGVLRYPKATASLTQVWQYYHRHTRSDRLLPEKDAARIKLMFDWPWIKMIDVVPSIGQQAADIMRAHNMKAGDSIHVASAMARSCEVIHAWDRDYSKTAHLMPHENPKRISSDALPPSQSGDLFLQ